MDKCTCFRGPHVERIRICVDVDRRWGDLRGPRVPRWTHDVYHTLTHVSLFIILKLSNANVSRRNIGLAGIQHEGPAHGIIHKSSKNN